ncbi:hypothetical protein PACTADRAFT_38896 [Pachysolen tannophilus NRRL Y-2460]|uniref:Histone-lysine N-methyltransferase, H3 lysine-79 specific n=1 Tax=Pachysolen tannophilus NRRL Y-2460 TaxID=669874 RepID=A0A1E4TYA7_PACTA|nr:hypothetical protein PACTADRAFT_38896 [Pachysolen tannophilus NRRL Y-2460]
MTPESVAASPKTPSSKKSRSESPPSDENSRLKSRGKSNKRKRNVKVKTLRRVRVKKEEKRNEEIIIQNNGAEKEEVVVEEEEEEEIEEEIFQWFLNLDCDVEIDINDRQLFIDQVYKLENIENNYSNCPPEENLISASDVVNQFPTHYTVTEKFPEATVFLATPFSNYKEKYLLKIPKDDELNPYEEIGKFMELIAISYLPEVYRLEIRNEKEPEKCIVGKYIKAYEAENSNEMLVQIVKFNELIDKLRDNKTILNYLKDEKRTIKRSIFHELLNQTYSRTISPNVQKLRGYKAFSNFVYGELLPNFLSTVYSRVGLNHKHTFIDLGSGVGNCVIQAALEYGCESYGCEIMEHASQLSKLQTIEFNKRCKVFGLKPGCVDHFLEQSFEDNLAVKKVVDRCDIILVNNYLFDSELNAKVIELLKDIKVGTKLISLKPLVPPGYTFNQLDVECILNRMTSKKYEYGSNSVSWTSNGGIYYISEVQPEIVSAYFMEHAKGRARSRKV